MTQSVEKVYATDSESLDTALGVTTSATQSDISILRAAGRLSDFAVVYRVWREQAGGGFGDQERNPQTWGVLVYVDGQLARIHSARGAGREWSNLDRLEKWLRAQGFWYWWTRNDLEALGEEDDQINNEDEDDAPLATQPTLPPFPKSEVSR